jgi:predicted nucleic acid-binding Zn ribbon protein
MCNSRRAKQKTPRKGSGPKPSERIRCTHCNKPVRKGRTKYCSDGCRKDYQKTRRQKTELQASRVKLLRELPCQVCGWDLASRDIHHIVGISKGGSNHSSNLVCLCPNDHRLADAGIYTNSYLKSLVYRRKKKIGF